MQEFSDQAEQKLSKKEIVKGWMPYYKMRYIFFVFITLISLAIPFIQINGHQIFLLSFDHKQLHLMGVAFDMQELYLMPFLLILLFMFIFFLTTLGGRVWCGWTCPQTVFRIIYRDLIETELLGLHRSRKNKQKPIDSSLFSNKMKKIVAIFIWTGFSFLAAANFLWYFVPPSDFFAYLQNPIEHKTLLGFWIILALFLVYDVVWLAENFCVYLCPYARIQSVMYDSDTVMEIYDDKRGGVIYDEAGNKIKDKPDHGDCVGCMACVHVCPTHIDIRKGMQLECINCLECADACAPIMAAVGKDNLIHWTSYQAMQTGRTRYFRFRIIAYIVIMSLAVAGLFVMGSKKEHMLLNINRTSELYSVRENGSVENVYTFLFQNTDSNDHSYYFEVVGRDDIKIIRPSEPFKLKADQKANKIVVLSTEGMKVDNPNIDTTVPVTIKAYATDDKSKVVVERKTVFIYPQVEIINKYKK